MSDSKPTFLQNVFLSASSSNCFLLWFQVSKSWFRRINNVLCGQAIHTRSVLDVVGKSVTSKHRWPPRVWWRSHPWFPSDTWAQSTGEEVLPWCWCTTNRGVAPCCRTGTPTGRGARRRARGASPWRWKASTARSTKRLWGVRSTWGSGGRDRGRGWWRNSGGEDAEGARQQPGRKEVLTSKTFFSRIISIHNQIYTKQILLLRVLQNYVYLTTEQCFLTLLTRQYHQTSVPCYLYRFIFFQTAVKR